MIHTIKKIIAQCSTVQDIIIIYSTVQHITSLRVIYCMYCADFYSALSYCVCICFVLYRDVFQYAWYHIGLYWNVLYCVFCAVLYYTVSLLLAAFTHYTVSIVCLVLCRMSLLNFDIFNMIVTEKKSQFFYCFFISIFLSLLCSTFHFFDLI